jgi:tetratricopeptide (TPR) repeat protein
MPIQANPPMSSHFSNPMKRITFTLFSLLVLGAMASAQQQPFQTPALLISKASGTKGVWLVAATEKAIRYREAAAAPETVDAKVADFDSIFILEPQEFTDALTLFNGRKYSEAKAKFAEVKERHKPLYPLTNSHAALAAFYELECLRKLGDLDALATGLQSFNKAPLTRGTQLRQIELYLLWDAVRTKSWDSLEKMVRERATAPLSADHRAQVAYCHGLALEGLQKDPQEALMAYQTALTADSGASEDVARQAALRIMSILNADEQVRKAIREWGTPAEKKNSPGSAMLAEAAAVATLYEMTLGAGKPLSSEFSALRKFHVKPEVKPQPEAEEPKADAPKQEAKPNPAVPADKNTPKK